MKVAITDPAEADLESIGDWIARDNPARAVSFVKELRQACFAIGTRPRAHAFVAHRRAEGIRRRVHGSYLIFYRVTTLVEIVHVLHDARDYENILFSEGESE